MTAWTGAGVGVVGSGACEVSLGSVGVVEVREGVMSATAFSAMDRSWYRELHGFPVRTLRWDGAESPQSPTGEH